MKILIYNTTILSPTAFNTDLEIITKHLKAGDEVHFLGCESTIASCENNYNHFLKVCRFCLLKKNEGLKKTAILPENIHKLGLDQFLKKVEIPHFNDFSEVKDFFYEECDIGDSVASSIISKYRETDFKINLIRREINLCLNFSIALYQAIDYWLKKIKPDLFYLYNGRTFTFRPALRAAQKNGIRTFVHINAGIKERYFLSENTYSHNLEYTKKQINQHWEKESDWQKKKEIAEQWFWEKAQGIDQATPSFVKEQSADLLPENFSSRENNIAIFNSSENEFESIDRINWQKKFYRRQNELLYQLLSNTEGTDLNFYLRVHPILAHSNNNSQLREIYQFSFPHLTIIRPEAKVSTYGLLKNCKKVLTFGSTTGIESAFWGKPSILAGRAFYEDLGSCYRANDFSELAELVRKDLSALPIEGALKFGYWEKTRGVEYQYHQPDAEALAKLKTEFIISERLNQPVSPEINSDLNLGFSTFNQFSTCSF